MLAIQVFKFKDIYFYCKKKKMFSGLDSDVMINAKLKANIKRIFHIFLIKTD